MPFEKIGNLIQSELSSVALRRERPESESEERLEAAERHAAVMLSAYRKIDCDDPEAWTTATVAVLARYPDDVMAEICHPQSGIQTRIKWPPVPQEIREAGDIALERKVSRERRAQLAQHRVLLDTPYGPKPEPEAVPILEAERQRVIAGFDKLKQDMAALKVAGEAPRPKPSPSGNTSCRPPPRPPTPAAIGARQTSPTARLRRGRRQHDETGIRRDFTGCRHAARGSG
jgi:hypothetical protein